MKVLVDDLLSLARSDSVRSSVVLERVSFSDLLNQSVLIFEPILFDMGKRLEYTIKDALYINGDTAKLRQLIDIIIDNACQYSLPESLITVSLKAVKNDICFEVDNTSEVIPKEELPRLFERFYRLDKSRSSAGYGLGLSIAKSIAEDFGGKIWATSEVSHTTVSVTLPAAR
jgi:signal transduction histidine kinase